MQQAQLRVAGAVLLGLTARECGRRHFLAGFAGWGARLLALLREEGQAEPVSCAAWAALSSIFSRSSAGCPQLACLFPTIGSLMVPCNVIQQASCTTQQ